MDQQQDLGKILYEATGPIARITLNWPEKANAQSADMVRQVPGTVVHRDLGELATHLLERAHLRDSQSGALD